MLAGILVSIGLGEAIGSAIGRSVAARLGEGLFGALDRVLGAGVGSAQALLIVWLVGGLMAAGPSSTLASQAQTSYVVRALNGLLPAPTEMAGELARLLDDTEAARAVRRPRAAPGTAGRPSRTTRSSSPSPASPSRASSRSAHRPAGPSRSGTGFVVERGYAVTNAHVIAGASTVRIAVGNQVLDAVPVFLDPRLDVALLYAPRLTAPALTLSAIDPERGAAGATFGFPGGGNLDVQPAAVAGAYEAQGRDIYGKARVTRSILEIRAEIDQGDSGGPLVLADGSIGGVVFAEARTDEEVGYALTPSSVRRGNRAVHRPDRPGPHRRLHPLTSTGRAAGQCPNSVDPDGIQVADAVGECLQDAGLDRRVLTHERVELAMAEDEELGR